LHQQYPFRTEGPGFQDYVCTMGTTDTLVTLILCQKSNLKSSNKATHLGIHFLLLHHLFITATPALCKCVFVGVVVTAFSLLSPQIATAQ